jgi:Ni/Co efflux regulator RcnB
VQVRATHLQPVRYDAPRHARHAVRVGDRLSHRELARAVRVDWRRAGLRAPARGQQWLALDGRRVLVARGSARVLRVI